MVGLLGWGLVAFVAYTLVVVALEYTDRLPEGVETTGPFVTLRSARGRDVLDWVARPAGAWRAFTTAGSVVVLALSSAMALGVVFAAGVTILDPGRSPVREPQAALVVPGVNSFLPLAAAPEILLSILVGLLVHEGCHGVLCRIEDIEIQDMGLVVVAILPIGAFVQPGEEQTDNPRGWVRMFAAGPASNLVVTALAFAGLLVVLSAIVPASGVAVGGTFTDGPAAEAGIDRGDVLTAVDGRPVGNASELDRALSGAGGTVEIERREAGPAVVQRRVTVVALEGPVVLTEGTTISAVNGTPVRTVEAFRAALSNRSVARLDTSNGPVLSPMGLSGRVAEDGPLTAAGLPADADAILTRVDGERVLDTADLQAVLDNASADESLSVTAFVDDERQQVSVRPSAGEGGDLRIGLFPDPGISGLGLTDFGVGSYPADRYLGVLGGSGVPGADSLLGRLVTYLTLPLASLVGIAPYNFAGFLDPMTNAFAVRGPLSALGAGAFTLANGLYWLAWLNVQVALFNCLPLWPLDGGRMLEIGSNGLGRRLGVGSPERVANAVVGAVGVLLVVLLLAVLFVPMLLA